MEQLFLEFGLKDGVFAGMFIFLLVYVLKTSKERENKLYDFLHTMKDEFTKLVGSYESLSKDVGEIKNELHNKMDKKRFYEGEKNVTFKTKNGRKSKRNR